MYRDDHDAALHRLAALQHELDETRRVSPDRHHLLTLRHELELARQRADQSERLIAALERENAALQRASSQPRSAAKPAINQVGAPVEQLVMVGPPINLRVLAVLSGLLLAVGGIAYWVVCLNILFR
jgi:chromosome segregation ATPase